MSRDELYAVLLKNKRCKNIIDDGAYIFKESFKNNGSVVDLVMFMKDARFKDWCYFMRVTYYESKFTVQCIDMPNDILIGGLENEI